MLGNRLAITWQFSEMCCSLCLKNKHSAFLLTVAKVCGQPKGRGSSEEVCVCNRDILDADYRCFAQAFHSIFQRRF